MKHNLFFNLALGAGLILFSSIISQAQNLWDGSSISTITTSGKVGIGDLAPTYKLSLLGNDQNGDSPLFMTIKNTSTSNVSAAIMSLSAGSGGPTGTIGYYASTYLNTSFASSLMFQSQGTNGINFYNQNPSAGFKFFNGTTPSELLTIQADGRVGIGTASPSNLLHLNGPTNPGLSVSSPGYTINLAVATCSGCYSSSAASGDVILRALNNGNDLIITNNGGTTSSGDIVFNTGSQNNSTEKTRMTIANDGKISIGDPATFTKGFPTGYKLYVASGILTEKVRIAVKSSNDWADYVFEPSYKLRSLTEVEKYIQINKHLPGIPSAQEVTETGIDVVNMNAKLLEKIEELTLYVIELKKENAEIKKQIGINSNQR